MVKKHDSTTSSDKKNDFDEIRTELDAIQHHFKKLFNAGGQMLLEQTSESEESPLQTLENKMKKNPLATALGVFVGGIILGRVFKSCRKKH